MEIMLNKQQTYMHCSFKTALVFLLILFSGNLFVYAENFKFRDRPGDANSYVSTVYEEVFLNGVLTHKSEIINRISSNVVKVDDGLASIHATYMTTENSVLAGFAKNLTWGEENISNFKRKENGELIIDDNTLYPTVRNVPVFPGRDIQPGGTWKANGKEVHDLRTLTKTNEPTIIPFTADYKYVEDVKNGDSVFNKIEVFYTFEFKNDIDKIINGNQLMSSKGYSRQTLFWDNKRGVLDHYNESFSIEVTDLNRNVYEFTGTAEAVVTEYKSINNDENVKRLQESIEEYAIADVQIRRGEKGLTISLENIQFEPDSWRLLPSEKIKLEKIGNIISEFSNDLLITGHCADRGSRKAQMTISEKRAEAVAEYLENLGVRDKYHIFTQGKGALEPIASNDSEGGREKNRRVEIVIMD